jgi:hypothetical protein
MEKVWHLQYFHEAEAACKEAIVWVPAPGGCTCKTTII